jgi:hypothetical protein
VTVIGSGRQVVVAAMNWVQSGSGFRANSPDELMLALSRIGTLNRSRRFLWRGAANHTWRLAPSLVRELTTQLGDGTMPTELDIRRRELASVREARAWGLGRELGDLATDMHMLALLQHHGIHTRLLDVTPNPMTALWFACQSFPDRNSSGVLFAFDVTDAPEYSTITDHPTWGSVADPHGWTLRSALAKSAADSAPFLVSPSLPDPRMRAQEGIFIGSAVPSDYGLPGIDGLALAAAKPVGKDALTKLFTQSSRTPGRPPLVPFCAIVVARSVKAKMRDHLSGTYNRTERTLFPDIAGFREAWNGKRVDRSAPADVVAAADDKDARSDPVKT